MRTLIISDLHFGDHHSKLASYRESLQRYSATCDQVIVAGDALSRYVSLRSDPESPALVRELGVILESRGGPPLLLTGNHDPAISDRHHWYHEASGLLAYHGDYSIDCSSPWRAEEGEFARRFREEIKRLAKPPTFAERAQIFRKMQTHMLEEWLERREHSRVHYLIRNLFPPHRPFMIMAFLWNAPRRAAHAARLFEQPIKHVVFGHTHRPGRWTVNGLSVYNTGSFMPLSAPHAVVIEDTQVRFGKLVNILK